MARLDDDLPISYNYRGHDSKLGRFNPRRAVLLKYVLTGLLVLFVLIFGFYALHYPDSYPARVVPGAGLSGLWKGSGPEPLHDPSAGSRPQTQPVHRTGPVSPPPPPPPSAPRQGHPVSTRPKQPSKEPASPFASILSGFIDPQTTGPMMQMMMDMGKTYTIQTMAPVLDSVFPPRTLGQLADIFGNIADGSVPISQAVQKSLLPLVETSGDIFVRLFPELGGEVVGSATSVFKTATDFMETANTASLASGIGHMASGFVAPLLGLSPSFERQAAQVLEDCIKKMMPDFSRFRLDDLTNQKGDLPDWIPSYQVVQDSMVTLVTDLMKIKAQEKTAEFVMGQFASMMTGGKAPAGAANGLADLAGQMIAGDQPSDKPLDKITDTPVDKPAHEQPDQPARKSTPATGKKTKKAAAAHAAAAKAESAPVDPDHSLDEGIAV